MANLNELQCLTTAGNTGIGSCFMDIKNIVGAILAPKGYELDVTTLQATLKAAALNSNAATRLYPLFDFETTSDSSEDKTVQTLGTGAKHVVREGFNDWTFHYVEGGLSLHQQARKFNGNAWDFFFIDAENKILGIAGSTSTKIKAIPTTGGFFWANPYKLNDGSKITEYGLQFVFNVKYSNDLVKFVKADFDIPSTIYGLENVDLVGSSAGTPGSYGVVAKTSSVGTNLWDLFATELASASLWKATNKETGGVIAITSVTAGSSVNKNFVFALNTSDADYPTTGQHVNIDLEVPATLDAAGVEGFVSTGATTIVKN